MIFKIFNFKKPVENQKVFNMNRKIIFVFSVLILFILISSAALAAAGDGTRFNTKTVKFFLNHTAGQVAAAGWANFTTNLSIQDTSITILSAYLQVSGTFDAAGSGAITTDIYLNDTSLGKYSMTRSAEVSGFEVLTNASRGASGSDFYSLGATPQYNEISIKCNGICNMKSTIAIITYKYDPPAEQTEKIAEVKSSAEKKPEKNIFELIFERARKIFSIITFGALA